MKEFIYILSNQSMPGLIKVGKTTTTPSKRMSELHSTGVPTPFRLELSIRVADCHAAERAAHSALKKYRPSPNREFFQMPIEAAIPLILPAIGNYELVEFRESFGVREIEAQIARDRERQRRSQEAARAAQDQLLAEKEREKFEQVASLRRALATERSRLERLGPRPVRNELPGFALLLTFCWMPIPIGWIVWIGTLQIFYQKLEHFGLACIALLIAGGFASSIDNKRRKAFEKANAPFRALDERVAELESSLNAAGQSSSRSEAPKVVIRCGRCQQQLRVPAGKTLEVTCPKCRHCFERST